MSRLTRVRSLAVAAATEVNRIWRHARRRDHRTIRGPVRSFACDPLEARVMLVAPVLSTVPDQTTDEAKLISVCASFSDADGPVFCSTYSATINWGDGTCSSTCSCSIAVTAFCPCAGCSCAWSGTVAASHAYADNRPGNQAYTATLTLSDGDSTATQTFAVTVRDVPPTLTMGVASTVPEGGSYLLTLARSDRGTDTLSAWNVNWGDGSAIQSVSSVAPTTTVNHTFAVGVGRPNITVTASDEDGGPYSARKVSLDTGFGTIGVATGSLGRMQAVAVQADGKIVAAFGNGGSGIDRDFIVARYNANGTLDTASFGTVSGSAHLGYTVVDFSSSSSDYASSIAIVNVNGTDRILVAGSRSSGTTSNDFAVLRFNASDGSLDTGTTGDATPSDSFGAGGKVAIDFNGGYDFAYGMAIQGDKIVLAGSAATGVGSNIYDFALARLNMDGSPDTGTTGDSDPSDGGFGNYVSGTSGPRTGKVTLDFIGTSNSAYDVAIDPSTSGIVVAGTVQTNQPTSSTGNDLAVARFTPDGLVDTTFGPLVSGSVHQGWAKVDVRSTNDNGRAVLIQADGKIVVGGSSEAATGDLTDFAMARWNVDGSLDDGGANDSTPNDRFGATTSPPNAGTVLTNFAHGSDEAMRAILQVDGRLVAVGYSTGAYNGTDFAAVRYMPDGTLDPTFGDGGKLSTDGGTLGNDVGYAAALQPDGKIVVGGVRGTQTAMTRYQSSSTLDVTVVPAAPTSLTADAVTDTAVALSWTDASQVETGFEVEASSDGGVTFAPLATTAGGAVTFTATQLVPQTTYWFRVRAMNGSLGSAYTAAVQAGTIGTPPTITLSGDAGNPANPVEGQTYRVHFSASGGADEEPIVGWVVHSGGSDITLPGDATFADVPLVTGDYSIIIEAIGLHGDRYVPSVGGSLSLSVANVSPTITTATADHNSVNEGDEVNLHAAATDPGGNDVLEYSWNVTKNGSPFATGGGQDFAFTPDDEGSYVATVSVVDGDEATTTQTVNVSAINVAPTVDAGAAQTVNEGDAVSLYGYTTDPGIRDALSYHWHVTASNGQQISDVNSYKLSFTPDDNGEYDAAITVSDGDGGSVTQHVAIHVNNVAPRVLIGNDVFGSSDEWVLGRSLTIFDPGTKDTINYDVDFGDDRRPHQMGTGRGIGDVFVLADYSIHSGDITITTTDNDGGVRTQHLDLTIPYFNNFQEGHNDGWGGAPITPRYDSGPVPKRLGPFASGQTATLTLSGIPAHDMLYTGFYTQFSGSGIPITSIKVDGHEVSNQFGGVLHSAQSMTAEVTVSGLSEDSNGNPPLWWLFASAHSPPDYYGAEVWTDQASLRLNSYDSDPVGYIPLSPAIDPSGASQTRLSVHVPYLPEGSQVTLSVNDSGADKVSVWLGSQFIIGKQTASATPVKEFTWTVPSPGWSFGIPGSVTVFGLAPSASAGDVGFSLKFKMPDGAESQPTNLTAQVIGAQLDVDSNSDSGFAPNPHTPGDAEDAIEDDATKTGKIIVTNDDDLDGDGIADFADGYNRDGIAGTDDDKSARRKFVPMVVKLPATLDPKAKIAFYYAASDPLQEVLPPTVSGTGKYQVSGGGRLRIWKKDAWTAGNAPDRDGRDAARGGNFIHSATDAFTFANVQYTAQQLGVDASGQVTLYVEALAASTTKGQERVQVAIDPDGDGPLGFITTDAVRFTAVDVNVLIGASDDHDLSVHDDWVGAERGSQLQDRNVILNYITLQGPPGVTVPFDMSSTMIAGSTGSVDVFNIPAQPPPPPSNGRAAAQGVLTTNASGFDSGQFFIEGRAASDQPENISITANYGNGTGVSVAGETMTVIQFNPEPKTYGASPIPVNPDVVTSRSPNYRGNLFAVDVGKPGYRVGSTDENGVKFVHDTGLFGGSLQPDINTSRKIRPGEIEVTWGRQFNPLNAAGAAQSLVTSASGFTTSQLAIAPLDDGITAMGLDNLRMRDLGITAAMENTGLPIWYLFGHPTEGALAALSIKDNYAAKIEARAATPISHPISVHVMELRNAAGGVIGSLGLTPPNPSAPPGTPSPDVSRIIDDLNTVWSQAGISFNLATGLSFEPQTTTSNNEFDVNDTSIPLTGYSTDNVTAINNQANVIDVYIVRRIGKFSSGPGQIAGTTIYEGMSGKAGILVAKQTTSGNGTQTRDIGQISRTLAHEMGHYLTQSDAHRDNEPWNLMYVDSDVKLDIDDVQYGSSSRKVQEITTSRSFVPVQ